MNAERIQIAEVDRDRKIVEVRPLPRGAREKPTPEDAKKPQGWMGDAPAADEAGMRVVSRIGFCPR